jgi:hypothetical protein|tara:strand:- start:66 stop:269 length:204 start_codon:yes stop_codon:yes gene_type:complete
MKINERTTSVLFALVLLITVSVLYRSSERYEPKKSGKRDEKITNLVKERNITQEDIDIMLAVTRRRT